MAFAGQVVLVTGAAGGIGGALARAFAGHGAVVVAADRVPAPAVLPDGVAYARLNVTDPASIATVVEGAMATHGRLDVLVNAAGVVSHGSALDLAVGEWDRVMGINLRGSFLCCQAALRRMKDRGYGRPHG